MNVFRDLEGYVSYEPAASDSYSYYERPLLAVYKPDFLPFKTWSGNAQIPQDGQHWVQVTVLFRPIYLSFNHRRLHNP